MCAGGEGCVYLRYVKGWDGGVLEVRKGGGCVLGVGVYILEVRGVCVCGGGQVCFGVVSVCVCLGLIEKGNSLFRYSFAA